MSSLSDFFDFLWEDTVGYVNISVISAERILTRKFANWPNQRERLLEYVQLQNAEGTEVYNNPALWKRKPQVGQPYSKEHFLGSHVLWCEFDGNAPNFDTLTTPSQIYDVTIASAVDLESPVLPFLPPHPGPEVAQRPSQGHGGASQGAGSTGVPSPGGVPVLSKLGILIPSAIVQSSSEGHQHVYWKLDELLTDVNQLENLNRTLAYELDADNCWDATRILRPPGTTNYGIGKPERNGKTYPVILDMLSDRQHPVGSFRQTKDFRPLVREALGKIPDLQEVLAKRQWDEEFYAAFISSPVYKKRSDQLQQLAYFGAESGFTDEEIYAVIDDADKRWLKYVGRNDRERQLVDIIERARAKHPLSDAELTFDGLLGSTRVAVGKEVFAGEGPTGIPDKLVYQMDEFLDLDMKFDWVIEGLLPRAGYGFIAGQNGLGKSQMGIRLGEAVIQNKLFLNKWKCVIPNAKVMFLSLEMEGPELQKFYKVMKGYGNFLTTGGDRFLTVSIGNALPLDKEEGRKFLSKLLTEHTPDLLIIDSLSMAMSGSFKDDVPVLAFNRVIKRIRREFNLAIVVIHHNRKGQDKRYRYNELDDLYGSRYLPQDTAFVLMLDKPKTLGPDELSVNEAKIRFSKAGEELRMVHREMDFSGVFSTDEGPEELNGSLFG